MAESDKKRFDTEMASYHADSTKPSADGKKIRRKKAVKDPNAPKRNLTAFFFFSNAERVKVKEANPDFGIGERWGDIDPNVKTKYEKLAEEDKKRYEKEKAEYDEQKKNGVPVGDTADSDSE